MVAYKQVVFFEMLDPSLKPLVSYSLKVRAFKANRAIYETYISAYKERVDEKVLCKKRCFKFSVFQNVSAYNVHKD